MSSHKLTCITAPSTSGEIPTAVFTYLHLPISPVILNVTGLFPSSKPHLQVDLHHSTQNEAARTPPLSSPCPHLHAGLVTLARHRIPSCEFIHIAAPSRRQRDPYHCPSCAHTFPQAQSHWQLPGTGQCNPIDASPSLFCGSCGMSYSLFYVARSHFVKG